MNSCRVIAPHVCYVILTTQFGFVLFSQNLIFTRITKATPPPLPAEQSLRRRKPVVPVDDDDIDDKNSARMSTTNDDDDDITREVIAVGYSLSVCRPHDVDVDFDCLFVRCFALYLHHHLLLVYSVPSVGARQSIITANRSAGSLCLV